MTPSVSVIVPCLNESAQIADAICSARQAGADEVIVADGGSTDDTAAVAAQHARVVQSKKPGRAVQQNLGAAHSTSDVLLFLHADCRLADSAIRQVQEAMEDHQVVGGAFRQRIDEDGIRYRLLELGNGTRVRLAGWIYGDQALFVRRSVFKHLGGFPPLQFMEDLYFSRQLKHAGRLVLLNGPLTVSARRWKTRGIVRQTLRNWSLIAAALCGCSPDRLARFYPNDR